MTALDVGLAPEASAGIRAAQDALQGQAARLLAVGDPIAPMISVFAEAAGAMHRLVVDASLTASARHEAVGQLIREGRKPWTREEMRSLVEQLDDTLLHRWTQFNRAGIAIGVGVSLLFGAICGGAGWWYRGYVPTLAGISAGAGNCTDRADGSRLCWIPIWEKVPPAAR